MMDNDDDHDDDHDVDGVDDHIDNHDDNDIFLICSPQICLQHFEGLALPPHSLASPSSLSCSFSFC